jgi:hypothetical protein
MSAAKYAEMLDAQGGACAICGRPPSRRKLAIDHDHATGNMRGLLCFQCNVGIGYFSDNPARMVAAIRYLRKHARSGPVG